MPEWEQFKWKGEFADMYLRTKPVVPVPTDTKRYPQDSEQDKILAAPLPTLQQMEEVRHKIAPHLDNLADGKGTSFGPFEIALIVVFHHVHDAYGRHKTPRHNIYRGEIGEGSGHIYERALLLHMTTLLERHCDQIRRCPLCRQVFLQNRRHQQYCGRRCQSVAVMQKHRAEEKAKTKKKSPNKRQGLTASRRRRARRGTKGRERSRYLSA